MRVYVDSSALLERAWGLLAVALVAVVGVAGWLLLTQPTQPGESANAATEETGPTSQSPAQPPPLAAPQPFQSVALYDFGRGLFSPENCFRPQPGVFPFLERIADLEAVHCVGSTYEAHLFRSPSPAEMRQERLLYATIAVPGSVRDIERPRTGSADQAAGRQFLFAHQADGYVRIYWDSVECLCGGILQADDFDMVAATRFWRGR